MNALPRWVTMTCMLIAVLGQAQPVGPARGNPSEKITIRSGNLAMQWGAQPGFGLLELRHQSISDHRGQLIQHAAPARCFEITFTPTVGPAVTADSLDFGAVQRRDAAAGETVFDLIPRRQDLPLQACITVRTPMADQLEVHLEFTSREGGRLDLVFPILEGIRPGDRVGDTGYFFPRDPGLKNDIPVSLRTNYGQYATCQLISVFNENWAGRGGGLFCIWADTTLHRKSFELVKHDGNGPEPKILHDEYGFPFWKGFAQLEGVGVASRQPNTRLQPGLSWSAPPVIIGTFAGPWQQALTAYRTWAETWYVPSTPERLRHFFTFESYHGYEACGFWAPKVVDQAIAGIPRGVDQLHFIVNNVDRYGDLAYREDWGLDGLKRFMEAAHAQGKVCSHYVQGLLLNETTAAYAELQENCGQKRADGTNATAFANQCMCCASPGWYRWLVDSSTRLVRDLGFDVIYLDTCGWTTAEKFVCFNRSHTHLPEYRRLNHMRDLLHTVKTAIRAIDPTVALTTEGPVVDLFFNDVDGNEGYGLRFSHQEAYGAPIHFMRFLYPRFKFLDLRTEAPRELAEVLLNGTATTARPEDSAPAARAHRLFHENADAYLGDHPFPDVPLREPGVVCNRFTGNGKTLHAVYNNNPYRVAGAVVPVRVPDGHHLVDLTRERECRIAPIASVPHAVVDLRPHETAVLAVLPARLRTRIDGMFLSVEAGGQGRVQLSLLDAEDQQIAEQPVEASTPLDLVRLTRAGRFRPALKLLEGNLLVDACELPKVEDIDIAQDAAASAGNASIAHGSAPGSTVGRDGSWKFAWNDEPRPGWIRLEWQRPQTINQVVMAFERVEYAPRDAEVQISKDGVEWVTVIRANLAAGEELRFEPASTRWLRVRFHQGGAWANHVSLRRLRVLFSPAAAEAAATPDGQAIKDAQGLPAP